MVILYVYLPGYVKKSQFLKHMGYLQNIPNLFHSNAYLVGGFNPPEKYESQIGSSSQLLGKIKFMFQTTNQLFI